MTAHRWALDGLDVDQGRRPAVERIPGPGHGDDPSAEGRVLRDVREGPEPDTHLIEAECGRFGRRTPVTRSCAPSGLSGKVMPRP